MEVIKLWMIYKKKIFKKKNKLINQFKLKN